jgi:propionyl-CoA synthetase
MLACARIGAIHSVVFGGFAAGALASRIEDSSPKVIVSSDGGSRGGKVVEYKPLLDDAITQSSHKPSAVLLADRKLAAMNIVAGRDHFWGALRENTLNAVVPCEWVDSTHPSYTLYTSGTTGKPKGVQRDTGGYAVALAASMKHIYCGNAGETYFSTSDIGWVVGHSYIIYGPLIAGMATIMYEGLPTRPDGGIWWSLVEKYKVTVMFSAPTAVRVLKKQDPALLSKYDLSSLRALFLAGEPLDEPTAQWINEGLDKPIIDNYWQTETGWPILGIANGVEKKASRFGSPGVAMYGYNVKLLDENTGDELTGADQKAWLPLKARCRPGACKLSGRTTPALSKPTGRAFPARWSTAPLTGVFATRMATSFILGRTDDVINVAGHRLGTREIEEAISSHPNISEVAVVGVADSTQGTGGRGVCRGQGRQRSGGRCGPCQAGGRGHESCGQHHWRRRAPGPRAFCDGVAQNPQWQAAAPCDSGGV